MRFGHNVMVDRVKVDGGVALCIHMDTHAVEMMEDALGRRRADVAEGSMVIVARLGVEV